MPLTELNVFPSTRTASDPWIVNVLGDPASDSWEISLVRASNKFGRESFGWFDRNKVLVSHNGGPCHWPLAPGLAPKMIELAKQHASELNAKQ